MVPGFFAESEHKIVRCLQHAAAQETAANPRPWACSIANLIVATASKQCCQKDTRLAWRYAIGSSAMPLPLTSLLPEWDEWKRGYLQNPSWQQPPLELDASNRITRKHQSQKHRPSVRRDSGKVPEKTRAALKERDEKRAMQRKARPKNKYSSSKAQHDAGSDVSLWCENVVQSGEIVIGDINIGKPKGNGKPKAKFIFHFSLIEFCQHLICFFLICIYIIFDIYLYALYIGFWGLNDLSLCWSRSFLIVSAHW